MTHQGALDIVFNKFAKDYKADGLTFLSITPSLVQSKASASKSGESCLVLGSGIG